MVIAVVGGTAGVVVNSQTSNAQVQLRSGGTYAPVETAAAYKSTRTPFPITHTSVVSPRGKTVPILVRHVPLLATDCAAHITAPRPTA